ncbi:hypothetical protein Ccrd_026259 [Cynara cardunculus var. scolymus]|uniref:Uncharacterized protein n=1 Tax=Cynara cardunculus var. scolymus TaxID=59895 RepID=A0A103RM98_CYNCS|nr:hypothetical protein Ccrd_026259 [Cynara cardunculus var. scolymus]
MISTSSSLLFYCFDQLYWFLVRRTKSNFKCDIVLISFLSSSLRTDNTDQKVLLRGPKNCCEAVRHFGKASGDHTATPSHMCELKAGNSGRLEVEETVEAL